MADVTTEDLNRVYDEIKTTNSLLQQHSIDIAKVLTKLDERADTWCKDCQKTVVKNMADEAKDTKKVARQTVVQELVRGAIYLLILGVVWWVAEHKTGTQSTQSITTSQTTSK